MMFDTDEQISAKLHEAGTALIAFNGVGMAGIIALLQRERPFSYSLRVAGVLFLIGMSCGLAAWFFGGPDGYREKDIEVGIKYTTIAIYAAAAAVLAGTAITFFTAG